MTARLVDRSRELETFPVGATKRFIVTDVVSTPFHYPCNVAGTLLGEGDSPAAALEDCHYRGNGHLVEHLEAVAEQLFHALANGAA